MGMRSVKWITWRWLVLLPLLMLVVLGQQPVVAQEPGDEISFQSLAYTSADGGSTITSQKAVLGKEYFATFGSNEQVTLLSEGLVLVEGASQGVYTSDPIPSPLGYTTDLAISWQATLPEGALVTVEARVSQDGQAWDTWLSVPVEYAAADMYSGPLIWVDQAGTYVQFRVTLKVGTNAATPVLQHVTLVFNDSSQGPSDTVASAQAAERVACDGGSTSCVPKPPVISRTAWGCPDGQYSPRWSPKYQPTTHIVINHTATPNSASDWTRVVRSIWNYHANILGWGDTSYQYLVDPLGNLYEGRAGGDDVIGADDGLNQGAVDVAYIGCYGNCGYLNISNANPSAAMLEAGNNLIAWKVGQKGLDPLGQGFACDTWLPTIIARSEVICRGISYSPGDNLRAQMAAIRDAVWRKLGGGTTSTTVSIPPVAPIPVNGTGTNKVHVNNVTGLYGVEFRLTFDPARVQVVDADANKTGVQVGLGSVFASSNVYVVRNTVSAGVIEVAVTLRDPAVPFNGSGSLVEITWHGISAGWSDLTLTNVKLSDRDGNSIASYAQNGKIEVGGSTNSVSGVVYLQGRADHSGTSVTSCSSSGTSIAVTDAQGRFNAALAQACLRVVHAGYLSGERLSASGNVGTLTLLGGDVNGDNCINIFDLAMMASSYGGQDAGLDINANGTVDIYDLTIAAGNFGKCGPLKNWQ